MQGGVLFSVEQGSRVTNKELPSSTSFVEFLNFDSALRIAFTSAWFEPGETCHPSESIMPSL